MRWLFNPLNTVLRCTSFNSSIANIAQLLNDRFWGWWVEGRTSIELRGSNIIKEALNDGSVGLVVGVTDNTGSAIETNLVLYLRVTPTVLSYLILFQMYSSIHVLEWLYLRKYRALFRNGQFSQIHVFIWNSNRSLVNNMVTAPRKVSHGIKGFNPFCCNFIYYCLNIFSLFSIWNSFDYLLKLLQALTQVYYSVF